ncbi:DNA-binding transcriptional regulator, MocR family, contains an aminotransferase domain [Sphingomonas laterariae]|uniref:DNA-binding transcriptional regulator, MocR family, contains an aminotransferase domain n=1 Tax=Edaphosphingomonas laterariae TaxID=861865 RepID=A0A239BXZ1_9SPHN|nr:PLP-dependent aminotransferase family protein [Sphingomonas laterariae]SNS12867.1 DNA-binding transcriptional regulator, MocR family, contains an aminotransferase domain [Sphingomonas laterariae]
MADRDRAGGSLVDRLAGEMRQRIASRGLVPGAKLPSIRALAESGGVSKSTAVEVYDRLVAEGVIQSRRGSGFYVAGHTPPLSVADVGPRLDRAIDPFWVSRQSLEAGDDVLKPGCGWLPPSWLPEDGLRRSLRTLARANGNALVDYGTPLGLPALRQLLARRMAERGIEASPDQILITESGTQAIDLLCRMLIEPDDVVLVDDPCYFNFHALLRAHRARIIGIPFTPNGPDMDAFAAALEAHRPRLYVTNSGIHNPTGATLSHATAHRLLKLAEAHDLTIIEDDIFADFEEDPAPRLGALDGLDRVIQIGSFSKALSASVRCGYVAIRHDWMERLVDLRIATSFGAPRLSAELVVRTLQDGSYRKHVAALRERLARARLRTAQHLDEIGISRWIEPRAGMFLWCSLPDGVDAAELARAALADGVLLAPGNVFSLTQSAGRFLRMNVAQCGDPRIFRVLSDRVARA